jgi:hypothetical protein
MGSRQKSMKAFLAACDDMIHDQWIPNEDWVHQIRDTGNDDCTNNNLNHDLSQQCLWQNDHAILEGTTIVYNKKQVRTSKTKATTYKNIRFYYVSTAGKPPPTVPSDSVFYQSLWDDPDRSNRSLKRTVPQAKKSKMSYVARAVSPQTTSKSPLPPSPPKSIKEANIMAEEA